MDLFDRLLKENKIIPLRKAKTEDGICYIFLSGNYSMYVEVYNDYEIGYIINNDSRKKILSNQDGNPLNVIRRIEIFLLNTNL